MDSETTPPTNPVAVPAAAMPAEQVAVWPGAFGLYRASSAAVRINFWTIVLLVIISGVLNYIPFIGTLIALVTTSPGIIAAFLAATSGEKISLAEALKRGWKVGFRYLGLSIVVGLSVLVAFLLLIIPGFFVLPRLALAPYFLVDQNMGIMEAYKASWHGTKGHVGKLWGIVGVSILMLLACIILIGIYWIIMYSAAMVLLYRYVKAQAPATALASAPSPAPAA